MQWIKLPCSPSDSLDWRQELDQARGSIAEGETIIWKLALGLELPFYPLDDEMRFQSASLAMTQFTNTVWPEFQASTEFVCLYRGSADFASFFAWSDRQKGEFEGAFDSKPLFCAESFAIYFQMLSHRLPDEARVLLLLDTTALGCPELALRVASEERFAHFAVGLRGLPIARDGLWWEGDLLEHRTINATAGVVFPTGSNLRLKELLNIQKVKIIFENVLSEEWEGLDLLYVIAGSLTEPGKRKLQGFRAAGGEVIEI